MLLSINNAYERVASLIMQNDFGWEWDDSNQTDLIASTTTLTSGQQDYSLAVTHLIIDRIEVKNSSGNWTILTQLDQKELKRYSQIALAEYRETNGIPAEYDLRGNSIFLYPIPDYTQAASLKIYFKRPPALFTSAEVTTGTKVPGFNSLFHDIIPLWVSYEYAVEKLYPNANGFFNLIQIKEKDLINFYQKRNKDYQSQLTTDQISFR